MQKKQICFCIINCQTNENTQYLFDLFLYENDVCCDVINTQ